jgi:CheY-like chemotaxis protein
MAQKLVTILLVEDDPEDSYLIGEAFTESRIPHKLVTVTDGEELMDYLKRRGQFAEMPAWLHPDLILLDLNMPCKDGREALSEIKADPDLRRIPVVVLTNSSDEDDIMRSYDLGVSGFITKPVSFMGLLNVAQSLSSYWLQIVTLPPNNPA